LKKVFSLLLLSVLIFPLISTYYSHQVLLKKIKREVKANLLAHWNKKKIETLTFTSNDLKSKNIIFHKEDFEIEIDGKMYDIIEQKNISNNIIIKCIPDEKESAFKSKIKESLSSIFSHHPFQKNQTKAIISFLENLFFEIHIHSISKFVDSFVLNPIFQYQFSFSENDILIFSPPPEL